MGKITELKTKVESQAKALEQAARGVETEAQTFQKRLLTIVDKYPLTIAYGAIAVIGTLLVVLIRLALR